MLITLILSICPFSLDVISNEYLHLFGISLYCLTGVSLGEPRHQGSIRGLRRLQRQHQPVLRGQAHLRVPSHRGSYRILRVHDREANQVNNWSVRCREHDS